VGGLEGAVEVSPTDSRVVLEKKRKMVPKKVWMERREEGITLMMNDEKEGAEKAIRKP
jgi:hypothetical protein